MFFRSARRFGCLACGSLAACNALSGAADLTIGDDSGTASLPPRLEDAASDAARSAPGDSSTDAAVDTSIAADAADAPFTGKRVFVTSVGTTGSFGGINGADTVCATRAASASLGGTWVAWISAGNPRTDAITRIGADGGPWHLVNGALVAPTSATLASGQLGHAIDLDEKGQPASGTVWTGTNNEGKYNPVGDGVPKACSGWAGTGKMGVYGSAAATDASWTNASTAACNEQRRIYCFEK